jgi:hypothetical protein
MITQLGTDGSEALYLWFAHKLSVGEEFCSTAQLCDSLERHFENKHDTLRLMKPYLTAGYLCDGRFQGDKDVNMYRKHVSYKFLLQTSHFEVHSFVKLS